MPQLPKTFGRRWIRALPLLTTTSLVLAACGGGGSDGSDPASSAPRYTLAGTLTAASNTAVDSDLNDPAAPLAVNDTSGSAQPLAAPILLSGYVNVPGAGPAGRSQTEGDPADAFRVHLKAGMRISLSIASTGADLDLYLYRPEDPATPVDSSVGDGRLETLNVGTEGEYLVVVDAVAGAAAYTLTLDQQPYEPAAAPDALQLSAAFVPGDILVKFRDQETEQMAADASATPIESLGLRKKAGIGRRTALLALGHGRARARALEALGVARPLRQRVWALSRHALEPREDADGQVQEKLETLLAIKALRARPDVEYAEPNYIRQSLALPQDPYFYRQWHYQAVNLPQAWDLTTGSRAGEPVTVAVVDTGVLKAHPDLQGVLGGNGYDFIADPTRAVDGDGIDADADDPGDQRSGGSSFHGTHVAGTIAARSNNGTGVAGVSWGARIMPVRVLGKDGGTSYDIMQGVRYAAGLPNDSGALPAHRAEIINLSLGGGGYSRAEQDLYRQVRQQGILVIAAGGNDGAHAPFYPAAYEGVVGVAAVEQQNRRAPYSNYGAHIDVAAPGGNTRVDSDGDGYGDGILSTSASDGSGTLRYTYRYANGTSMAAPHVAGIAALMKAIAPALSPDQFDAFLSDGALTGDLGTAGRDDEFGHGLIDAYKAVLAAHQVAGTLAVATGILVASPTTLDFGSESAAITVNLSNNGAGELRLTGLSDDADWLSVVPEEVDESGLGGYSVRVNRAGLPPGEYQATVSFESSANSLALPVRMSVPGEIIAGALGRLYVVLVDAQTLAPVAQVEVSGGDHGFRLQEVPAGQYYLLAGADVDNDGYLCGPGEACGGYPSLEGLKPVAAAELPRLGFGVGLGGQRAAAVPVEGVRRLR